MLLGSVRVAQRRPYISVALALVILIIRPMAALQTPTEIPGDPHAGGCRSMAIRRPAARPNGWPDIYSLPRILTTAVNDSEHIAAYTCSGISAMKILFLPGVDISVADAEVTAVSQVALRQIPA